MKNKVHPSLSDYRTHAELLFGDEDFAFAGSLVLDMLFDFFLSGRIPHAILFYGEEECGKKALASFLAKALLCKNPSFMKDSQDFKNIACGNCNSCYKADNGLHPDIVYVKDKFENGRYKVDILRDEIRKGSLLPNDGKYRVFIFEDIDTMTPVCQNTLLKFIEEPADFNRFIFTAASDRNILPTINSRVTALRTDNPGCAEYPEELNEERIEALEIARRAADALFKRDEYLFVAALAASKTRETMLWALSFLHRILRGSIFDKNTEDNLSISELVQISEKIENFIFLQEFNPNLNLAAAAYSAEIFIYLTATGE